MAVAERDTYMLQDHETRLSEVETFTTQLKTIKTMVGWVLALAIGGIGGFSTMAITDHARLDQIERAVAAHEGQPFHHGAGSVLGELRADVRVIRMQVETQAGATQEIRERVTRIEDSGRTRQR